MAAADGSSINGVSRRDLPLGEYCVTDEEEEEEVTSGELELQVVGTRARLAWSTALSVGSAKAGSIVSIEPRRRR